MADTLTRHLHLDGVPRPPGVVVAGRHAQQRLVVGERGVEATRLAILERAIEQRHGVARVDRQGGVVIRHGARAVTEREPDVGTADQRPSVFRPELQERVIGRDRQAEGAFAAIGQGEVDPGGIHRGIERRRAPQVRYGSLMVAVVLEEQAAIAQRRRVVRLQRQGTIEIRPGEVEGAQLSVDDAAVHERRWVVRPQANERGLSRQSAGKIVPSLGQRSAVSPESDTIRAKASGFSVVLLGGAVLARRDVDPASRPPRRCTFRR